MAGTIYCIDTSSLIHAWRRAYPPKRFPGLWAKLKALVDQGRLVASIEVLSELKKKDDEIAAWAGDHKGMFLDIDEVTQTHLVAVMRKFPKLVDTGKGKSGGDPFVIALAMSGNPPLTVVTQEQGGSTDKPKMPFVCHQVGLQVMDLLTMIEHEDWSF